MSDDEFDVVTAADEYTAATRLERTEMWDAFSLAERHALAAGAGIVGPVSAGLGEDFEVIHPADPRYAAAMQGTRARVRAGLSLLRSGDLDAAPDLADEIESLAESAEMYPDDDDRHYGALQRAERLIEQARHAQVEAIPFAEGMVRTRVESPDAEGNVLIEETDYRGKKRVTVVRADDIAEAERAERIESDPWGDDPALVTLAEAAEWDYRTWDRFEKLFPSIAEALAMGDSPELDEATAY